MSSGAQRSSFVYSRQQLVLQRAMSATTSSLSSYQLEKLNRHTRSRSESSWSVTSRAKHRVSVLSDNRGGGANGAINNRDLNSVYSVPPADPPTPSRWSWIITIILMILAFIKRIILKVVEVIKGKLQGTDAEVDQDRENKTK